MLRLSFCLLLTALVLFPMNALADAKKLALLIGNQSYASSVGPWSSRMKILRS